MSRKFSIAWRALVQYAGRNTDDIHDLLGQLKAPLTPLERASLTETMAEAMWNSMRQEGVPLAHARRVYFIARAYDDDETRMIIIAPGVHGPQVVLNEIWNPGSSLRAWGETLGTFGDYLRTWGAAHPAAEALYALG